MKSQTSAQALPLLPPNGHPIVSTSGGGSCPFLAFTPGGQQLAAQMARPVNPRKEPQLTAKRLSLLSDTTTAAAAAAAETKEEQTTPQQELDAIETHSATTATTSADKASMQLSLVQTTLKALIEPKHAHPSDTTDTPTLLDLQLSLKEEMLFKDPTRALVLVNIKTHKIEDVNDTTCLMFGLPKTNLLSQNINILMPDGESKKYHDRAINYFMAKWRSSGAMPVSRFIGGGQNELSAIRISEGRQELFSVILRTTPLMSVTDEDGLPVYFAAYMTDNSLMRQYQIDLSSHKFLQQHTYTPSIEINLSGIITRVNSAAAELFNYHESSMLGCNIKELIFNEQTRTQHDGYLSRFRETLEQGAFNPDKSRIVNRERDLQARNSKGDLILVQLKVLLHPDIFHGKDHRLIGIFTDTKKFIPSALFNLEQKRALMPTAAIYEDIIYHNCCVIDVDIAGSTDTLFKLDEAKIKDFLKPFHQAIQEFADECCVNVIKGTGDGVLVLSSELDLFDSTLPYSRIERSLLFALRVYFWAKHTEYKIRIGIAEGTVGAGMIPLSHGRTSWDIYSRQAIQEATRMQTSAFKYSTATNQQIQIASSVYEQLSSKYKKYFKKIEYNPGELKGLGADEATSKKEKVSAYILDQTRLNDKASVAAEKSDSTDPSKEVSEHVNRCVLKIYSHVQEVQRQKLEIEQMALRR